MENPHPKYATLWSLTLYKEIQRQSYTILEIKYKVMN